MRSLGEAGEIEPETESILLELGIDDEEFPPEVLECLPPSDQPWTIPPVSLFFKLECHLCIQMSSFRRR